MTSGLVLTLDDSPACEFALATLNATPVFTAGERIGHRLPVALEVGDADASEQWTAWLRRLPGIEGVEVVFVHWDEAEPEVIHDGA